jgi:hypothetical protein
LINLIKTKPVFFQAQERQEKEEQGQERQG